MAPTTGTVSSQVTVTDVAGGSLTFTPISATPPSGVTFPFGAVEVDMSLTARRRALGAMTQLKMSFPCNASINKLYIVKPSVSELTTDVDGTGCNTLPPSGSTCSLLVRNVRSLKVGL